MNQGQNWNNNINSKIIYIKSSSIEDVYSRYNAGIPANSGTTADSSIKYWFQSPEYKRGQAKLLLPNGNVRTFTETATNSTTYTADQPGGTLTSTYGASGTTPDSYIYTDTQANSVYRFNATGQLTDITARNGWVTRYTYNATGQLTTITNAFGRNLTLAYTAADASGLLASVTTPEGGVIRYSYDAQQRLTTVSYPDNTSKQYLYEKTNAPNLLTGVIDQNGKRLATYDYDTSNRATLSTWAGGANQHRVSYSGTNPVGAVQTGITVTDPLGTNRNYGYSSANGKAVVTDASAPPANPNTAPIRSRTADTQGNITKETDFNGNVFTYVWDAVRNLLLSRTDPVKTTSTQWHPTLSLPTQINEGNQQISLTYDDLGNVLTRTVKDVSAGASGIALTWTYTWNAQGLMASETAPGGATTSYGYDALGNLTSIKNPLGHITSLAYDAAGRVVKVVDANGVQTIYVRDVMGRIVQRILAPAGTSTTGAETDTFTYTPSGQLASAALASGWTLTYAYDDAQRLIGVADNRGHKIAYTLDGLGNRTQTVVTDRSGRIALQQSAVVNSLNRIAALTTGANSTTFGQDANGQTVSQTNALGAATSQTLDALGRPVQQRLADGASTSLTYDAQNQVTQATDPNGVNTQYQVNAVGQVAQTTSPDIGTVQTTYNAQNLVASRTDALGQRNDYSYDTLGRVTQITATPAASASSGSTAVTLAPRTTQLTTRFTYDQGANAVGKLSRVEQTRTLDLPAQSLNGQSVTTAQSTTVVHTTDYAYDTLGRIASKRAQTSANGKVNADHTLQYRWAAGGALMGMTTPAGTKIDYTRSQGQITAITVNGLPLLQGIQTTALGQPQAWQQYSPRIKGSAKNAAGLFLTISREYGTQGYMTSSGFMAYYYDAFDRITMLTGSDTVGGIGSLTDWANQRYFLDYDNLDRLTQFDTTTYAYDPNGNRTRLQVTNPASGTTAAVTTATDYRYQAGSNRLQTIGSQPVNLDANGAQLQRSDKTLAYDASGRLSASSQLTDAKDPRSGQYTLYLHDAAGQRSFKSGPQASNKDPYQVAPAVSTGNTWNKLWDAFINLLRRLFQQPPVVNLLGTSYIYDEAGNLIGEYSTGSNTTPDTEYIWLPAEASLAGNDSASDTPVAVIQNNQAFAIHSDHLNTPRMVTNANNQAVWLWPYSGFGETAPVNPTTNQAFTLNLRYPGQYFDQETGLFDNWHRSYDPQTGRYTQADPIGLNGGWSRFAYVGGNALKYSDPKGLDWYRSANSTEKYVVGRDGNLFVPPGGTVSRFIEQCVPAGRTFGEIHDARVDELTSKGVPDWRANIPSMPGAYTDAVHKESLNSIQRIQNGILNLYRGIR